MRLEDQNRRENERYERREEMLERMRLGYENRREKERDGRREERWKIERVRLGDDWE